MTDRALWERLLAFDEASHDYFAEREEWPGAVVFTCRELDELSVALIGGAPAPDPEALLEAIVGHFQREEITPRVCLTPLSQPADWEERLQRRGFAGQPSRETFMLLPEAAPLSGSAARDTAGEIAVRRVRDAAGVERFVETLAVVFGLPERLREWMVERARRDLEGDTYRLYLAALDGEPAGAATARMRDGVTGIYGVGTLERFRRLGVCSALMRRIVAEARAAGHGLIYLSAQTGSCAEGLYSRMGFVSLFTVHTYELPAEPAQGGAAREGTL